MISLFTFFITLQITLFFFMTFHDWVHLPPLTDIRELEKYSTFRGRLINSAIFAFTILIPLGFTVACQPYVPMWVSGILVFFYGVLTLGTLVSWWVPYFFGNLPFHEEHFKEYVNTHHFLPARGDNVIPNTMHVMLHLQIWTCLGISLYLLVVA